MTFTRTSITSALNEAFEKQQLGSVNVNESAPIKTVQEYNSDLAKVNEAEMDKRFMKDWDKSCTALLNHIEHESKKPENKQHYRELNILRNHITEASSVPNKLANIVGTN